MENQKLEACYSEHSSTLFFEILGEDENYQRLKNAKIAAEKALRDTISKEALLLVVLAPKHVVAVVVE